MKKDLDEIILLIGQMRDDDLSQYDKAFLMRTIETRMSVTGISSSKEYSSFLSANNPEIDLFYQSLHISYSEFFRNQLTFSLLEQHVLPGLIAAKQKSDTEIRIWSAGCAAGQEAYSIAILLDELTADLAEKVSFRVFATDRSYSELDCAQKGVYDAAALRNVRLKHLEKYFYKSGDSYLLNDRLKKMVNFSLFDLLDQSSISPPSSIYGDFDIVFCSNLLFYYRPETRQLVLDKVLRSLSVEGILVTGEAEISIVEKHGGFTSFAKPSALFRKAMHRGTR